MILSEDFWCSEGAPELDRGIDHCLFLGADFGSARQASERVARSAGSAFAGGGRLADHVAVWRQNVGERLPGGGGKNAVGQRFDFVVEPLERCSITTADNPGTSSP